MLSWILHREEEFLAVRPAVPNVDEPETDQARAERDFRGQIHEDAIESMVTN